MKNRFSKLIEKDGFYIILFICVCIVAIAAVMTSKGNLDKSKEDNLSKIEDFVIIDESELEPSLEIARIEENIMAEDDGKMEDELEEIEEDSQIVVEDEEQEYIAPKASEDMMVPVKGKIGVNFTTDNLIYSETLEEWTSHKGVDIFAEEGMDVKATTSGMVTEVYRDELWGIVILIDHGDGLMSKYANLSTDEMVKEGTKVNKGDVISKIGKSATIEMMMEPHIHFEVIKDGVNVNPENYIPAFNY